MLLVACGLLLVACGGWFVAVGCVGAVGCWWGCVSCTRLALGNEGGVVGGLLWWWGCWREWEGCGAEGMCGRRGGVVMCVVGVGGGCVCG